MKPRFHESKVDLRSEAERLMKDLIHNPAYTERNIKKVQDQLERLYNNLWMDGYSHGYNEAMYDLQAQSSKVDQ